jgi:hypothetical protein
MKESGSKLTMGGYVQVKAQGDVGRWLTLSVQAPEGHGSTVLILPEELMALAEAMKCMAGKY